MLNVCIFTGRLGANPKVNATSTGKEFVQFKVGCSRNYPDRNRNYITDWIPCVAWDKTGAFIYKYFKEGDFISLVGELRPFNITANDKTYKSFSINVTSVSFGGGNQNSDTTPGDELPSSDTNTAEGTTTNETNVFNEFNVNEFEAVDDELPF